MTKLFLIRHGLTEWNKLNKFQGSSDISLCKEGVEQAKKLASRLSSYNFEAIYASDLSRAYDTATYIAQAHNLVVKKIPELREIHFGEWEGLTKDEIIKLKNYDFNRWKVSPHSEKFPGEGSFLNVQRRVMKGIHTILSRHTEGNIVIVSHGGSLKIIILSLLELDLSFYRKFWLGNTSLSIIELQQHRSILNLLNDMSHLENSV
ncbi:MAG: phosphoserine phosphatase [Clostridiales bacterium]|jgi:broad specificity phosphatase PhoE|nr:phosphoserine phosphatase [Clostridiales bacterium]MDK2932637.1 phosphoserine phosphatase [Clostridiales bacterium]